MRTAFGDPSMDINQLYQTWEKNIRSYLRKYLGDEEAEDILHDTMEKFLREAGAGRIREDQAVSWLFRVAHNAAIDTIRRNRRTAINAGYVLDQASAPSSEQKTEDSELFYQIEELAARFDASGRGVLLLHMLTEGELTQAQMAAVLRVSERTVRRETARLFAFLQKELEKKGYSRKSLF